MSERTSTSPKHLFRLLSVYTGLALVGVLVTLLYGQLSQHPQVAVWGLISISFAVLLRRVILRQFVQFDRMRLIEDMRRQMIADSRFSEDEAFLKESLLRTPILADFIFYILLPNGHDVIGDLHEGYFKRQMRFSKRHADIWFWKELLVSVIPLLKWRWKSALADSKFSTYRKPEYVKTILPFYRREKAGTT